jgi:hypothetical protein
MDGGQALCRENGKEVTIAPLTSADFDEPLAVVELRYVEVRADFLHLLVLEGPVVRALRPPREHGLLGRLGGPEHTRCHTPKRDAYCADEGETGWESIDHGDLRLWG